MFLPLFAVAIIMTPILGLLSMLLDSENTALALVSGFSMGGYVLILVALGIASFVLIFIRFYRSTAKDEGYLLFTLPAKTIDILFSKLIVSVIWEIASAIVIGLSILVFTYMHGVWSFNQVSSLWDKISALLTMKGYGNIPLLFSLYLISMLISTISGTLQVFASIGLGQTMKNHRVAFSIMYYVISYIIIQTISTIALIPFMLVNESSSSTTVMVNYQLGFLGISAVLSLLYGVAFFFVANYCYKKKLNLE